MSTDFLQGKAADLAKANPTAEPQRTVERRRIPMSLPERKLHVPDLPGYVLHWFRGTPGRIEQAQRAGYEFVSREEIELTQFGVANDALSDGNTDLGSRVSLAAAEGDERGGAMRLYLMKIRQEFYDEDTAAIEAKHEEIAATIRGDRGFTDPAQDNTKRYSRGESRNILTPKR